MKPWSGREEKSFLLKAEFQLVDISVKNEFYVTTGSPPLEERVRVLKYGAMFAVFDRFGDIRISGMGEHGIYYRGTRFLSRLTLLLGHTAPLFLSSGVRADNVLFSADLTNVDLLRDDKVVLPKGSVHLVRSRLLWEGVSYEQMRFTNYGPTPVRMPIRIEFASDFADIFEVRGVTRPRRGELRPELIGHNQVVLSYKGLDNVIRNTRLYCSPGPSEISESHMLVETELVPRETVKLQFIVQCEETQPSSVSTFDSALASVVTEINEKRVEECAIRTSNNQFNSWLDRSLTDVHMMTVGNSETDYPYAGVPWFSTVFGRDGIITALECLWVNPQFAKGVLQYLAATQALERDSLAEAQPGKILHETRHGEMAALGEIPFGCYYGSVDSTPLFVMLAGAFYQRTADLDFIRALFPHIELAIAWIDQFGDIDGDGFVEYQRQSTKGLIQQGWKDSSDSVFHANGSLAEPPIALCEVQGYAFAAKRCAAMLSAALGDTKRAQELDMQARILQQRFENTFWCDELSTYALALDGKKQPCRVRTSNAGHCLYTGIASPNRASRVRQTLMQDDSFSGWGIRTVSSSERNYNPISYHNGSVWPHDNAIIAVGFSRYGFTTEAANLLDSLFEASSFFELDRLPELVCGLHRRPGEGPTLYPVACSPQAWSAGSAFMLLQASLGLSVDASEKRILLDRPVLPASISSIQIDGLQLGDSRVDLHAERCGDETKIEVTHKEGTAEVVVR
jgi:glycogen debranching enzyme